METISQSELLNIAVEKFSQLPGIGKKTALRLVLDILKRDENFVFSFAQSITNLKENIKYCKHCGNLSDQEVCPICQNTSRDQTTICIVENIRDVMAIEQAQRYQGVYHVLGGLISPIDGIGPNDLNIAQLIERIETGQVSEIIFALSANMEGDTTCFYLSKILKGRDIKISTIARGVAFGGDLEFTDEVTLIRSIENRQPYNG